MWFNSKQREDTKLKVNPQKVKEIMSLALDIDHSLWNKDEAGDD